MSDAVGVSRDIYGSPEDWGLSKPKHSEICAELEDHLYCLQAEEGIPAADAARDELNKPQTRRKLAGVHLTNQVYATLNRLPTKQEWRELIFLLVCFTAILLSDWLAVLVGREFHSYQYFWRAEPVHQPEAGKLWLIVTAWLLQGLARGAFYAGFAYTLWRAWQYGTGVMLARILQLKLIHTVLVVAAMLLFDRMLESYFFVGYGYQVPWPTWLSAPVVTGGFVLLAITILVLSRRRAWALALTCLITGLFLYPGGPAVCEEVSVTKPIEVEQIPAGAADFKWIPSTDQSRIERLADLFRETSDRYTLDVAANKMSFTEYHLRLEKGMYLERGMYYAPGQLTLVGRDSLREHSPTGNKFLAGPLVAAGGGMSWLAVPIPLLGLVGFIGLVVIMGRRGFGEFLAYSAICVLAIVTTIVPFLYGLHPSDILDCSALGVLTTPLPGFEKVLLGFSVDASWFMLIGGLVFSAGIPWLLTSLFLRPEGSFERGSSPDSGETT